jgi:Ca2+-binding RTX toxin-like protein
VKDCREITAEDDRYNARAANSHALSGALLHAAGAEKPASLLPPGIDSGDAIGVSHWDDIVDDVPPPADGIFRGTAGADRIAGLQFDEVFRLKDGRDRLEAGRGDDAAYGGGGRDRLSGQAGADELRGGSGHDVLNGGGDDDTLHGGAGHDTLHGGWGADFLVGGAGADVFSFTNPGGRDVVADFEDGLDLLRLEVPGITDFAQLVLDRSGASGENTLVSFEQASIELVGLDLDRFGPEDVAIPLVSALV